MVNSNKWPPLNCLRGFKTAAQLGSFSKAAESLHMTQSAISHQIKTLEEWLDQPLFIRINRRVVLTDAGKDLLTTTEQCLETLEAGFKRLEHYKKTNQIILQTQTALASLWLLPRLSHYRSKNPHINVWLYTADEQKEPDLTEVHLGLVYGGGDWATLLSTKLLDNLLLPLCRPDHPVLQESRVKPQDFLNHDLLHSELEENWNSWFSSIGMPDVNPVEGPTFSDQSLLLQAIEQGQGIGLGSLPLAFDLIHQGRLVCPFKQAIRTRESYYLVSRVDGLHSPLLPPFTAWLSNQCESFENTQLKPLLQGFSAN